MGGEDDGIDLKHFLTGSEGVDRKIEEDEESSILMYLIKSADSLGIARLYLDLDEYFSNKEKVRMLRTMKRQLGYMPTKGVSDSLLDEASTPVSRNCK